MTSKWDHRYLALAAHVATWSKDKSTQVGAVLVSPRNRVIALGFNGFPPGVADDDRLQDRNRKLDIIIHGEINAILTAAQPLTACTLYTHPFLPCSRCAAIVIQAGVLRVVAPKNYITRWENNLEVSREIFREAGVSVSEMNVSIP